VEHVFQLKQKGGFWEGKTSNSTLDV
jgi:hypothetical protein